MPEIPVDEEYGRRMAVLPAVFGMSHVEFAESLGQTKNTWRHYTAGRNKPRSHVITMLWERYGIDANYVFLGRLDGIARDEVRKKVIRLLG